MRSPPELHDAPWVSVVLSGFIALQASVGCGYVGFDTEGVDAGSSDANALDSSRPDAAAPDLALVGDAGMDGGASDASTCTDIYAESANEFSTVQGQDGWEYGYYVEPFTAADFVRLTEVRDFPSEGLVWTTTNYAHWTFVSDDAMHPNGTITTGGKLPVEQWVVRRWTSDIDANAEIAGRVARLGTAGSGNGVVARILVDGQELFSQRVLSTDTEFAYSVNTPLTVGTVVDFVVDPFLSDDGTDQTLFTSTIACAN